MEYGKYLRKLKNKESKERIFYDKMTKLLGIRKKQKAFHPNAPRFNIKNGKKIYAFKRVSLDKRQTIICITNLSSKKQISQLNERYKGWKNLIGPKIKFINKKFFELAPHETVWISNIYFT